jgi:CBS-domain-containing membrane protein
MSPRSVTDPLVREAPLLHVGEAVESAVRRLHATDLPALPVVDDRERLKGIFGEREFFKALFPGYLSELKHAGFVPRSLEATLEKRATCRAERVEQHMNAEHVEVETDFSDAQVAETFLHHRVLVLPVIEKDKTVAGVITRADFFHAVAGRFLEAGGGT